MSAAQSHPFQIQERDIALLRGLFESRVMTATQIASLFFDGKPEAAKKRLQKLKAAEFVGERRRRAYEPSVLSLTPKAFVLLRDRGALVSYPRFALGSLERRSRVSEPGNVNRRRHCSTSSGLPSSVTPASKT